MGEKPDSSLGLFTKLGKRGSRGFCEALQRFFRFVKTNLYEQTPAYELHKRDFGPKSVYVLFCPKTPTLLLSLKLLIGL